MQLLETFAIRHPADLSRDLGLLKITTDAAGGPHLATEIEIYTHDGGGIPDGSHRLVFLKTELIDAYAPRRFRHLRLVNDNGGRA